MCDVCVYVCVCLCLHVLYVQPKQGVNVYVCVFGRDIEFNAVPYSSNSSPRFIFSTSAIPFSYFCAKKGGQ
jgi:hypothetical protein